MSAPHSPQDFIEVPSSDASLRLGQTTEVIRRRTPFQELLILNSPQFGRVLVLDGLVQTTEADEFIYHEMVAHVPVLGHGSARTALVIGGGDGGAVRELLRHRSIERVVMVEIDRLVTELCATYMPSLNRGAFDDARLELRFEDGIEFVASAKERFDIILVDSTDPGDGPGENLFGEPFYRRCLARLADGGVLVTQNGCPFTEPRAYRTGCAAVRPVFGLTAPYLAAVPTFVGGPMAFVWATREALPPELSVEVLRARLQDSGLLDDPLPLRQYSPEVHAAAFAIPAWLAELAQPATGDEQGSTPG